MYTLESGIDVGQGITGWPGKFVKNNKRRALNKRRACTKCASLCYKKHIKFENICRTWEKFQNLISVGPLMRLQGLEKKSKLINVGPGKFGKKNKRRTINTHVLCSN